MVTDFPSPWLLLDFDNCLMATERLALPPLIARFNALYGDRLPHLITLEEFNQNFHGQAREDLCRNLSTHFGIEVDSCALYHAREWQMMQHFQQTGVEMAPHLIETLSLLDAQGYKFSFVSNNHVQRALAAMRYATNGEGDRLARFFGTSFFEAGDAQKPKPDIYLRAMAQLGISPHMCFAVEDSLTGAQAALSAGLRTFGFIGFADTPQETERRLKDMGCLACFQDWNELPNLLSNQQTH